MSDIYRRLASGFPERKMPGKDHFQADARSLARWIEALPLANAAATARLLYQALREMNTLKIDGLARLAALESLRAPVHQIVQTVDRQIIGSSFPLPPQKAQLGSVAQDFQFEMAQGYRMAAYEICAPEGKVPFLRGKSVALALTRAASHLAAQLAKAYLVYAAPASGTWSALHDVFRFAQSIALDDKAVEDPLLGGAEVNVRLSYTHALLLAISNPYRLGQKEIYDSTAVTLAWAPVVSLRGGGASSPRAFSIPLEQDAGPGYIPEERRSDSIGLAHFDTVGLERDLERQLAFVNGEAGSIGFRLRGAPVVTVSAELVKRLVASWQPISERSHQRWPAHHTLDTLIGLHAVHFNLAGGQDFEAFMRRMRGPAIQLTERERTASWASGGAEAARPERVSARINDQSLGGYRLEWPKAESLKARVGEVIGLALPSDEPSDQHWMIGVVRWLRIGTDRVEAGVELIARTARAAAVRALDHAGHPRAAVRAIRMESLEDAGDPSYLAPQMSDLTAARVEVTEAPEPYGVSEDCEVRILTDHRVREQSVSYLRLTIEPQAQSQAA